MLLNDLCDKDFRKFLGEILWHRLTQLEKCADVLLLRLHLVSETKCLWGTKKNTSKKSEQQRFQRAQTLAVECAVTLVSSRKKKNVKEGGKNHLNLLLQSWKNKKKNLWRRINVHLPGEKNDGEVYGVFASITGGGWRWWMTMMRAKVKGSGSFLILKQHESGSEVKSDTTATTATAHLLIYLLHCQLKQATTAPKSTKLLQAPVRSEVETSFPLFHLSSSGSSFKGERLYNLRTHVFLFCRSPLRL